MDLKDIISISGLGGLYKMESQRDNGAIVKELGQLQGRFVATRKHDITPLNNITIYDDDDGAELIDVFIEMKKQEATVKIPELKASETDLAAYLEKILPKYDREQVYVSDMRKLVKWYRVLDNLKLVDTEKPEEDDKADKDGASGAPKTKETKRELLGKGKPVTKTVRPVTRKAANSRAKTNPPKTG